MIDRSQEEIMCKWNINNLKEPLVSVQCITYNHESYLEQALDGILMQETSFPFEVIVHDDASKDHTADIIRKYERNFPKIIKPIYESENQWSKNDGSLLSVVNSACNGKYVAICEGDDYWIDKNKLQVQITFLEDNPKYVMTVSDAIIKTDCGELDWGRYKCDSDISLQEMVLGGGLFVQTCTIVYLKKLINDNYPDCCKKCLIGDYPLQIWATLNGCVRYFSSKMAVYRYQMGTSWTQQLRENYKKFIPTWKSEINLLKGLDEYSNKEYHQIFKEKQSDYIYSWIVYGTEGVRDISDIKKLMKLFSDEIHTLSFIQKIKVCILKYDFFHIVRKIISIK